MQKIPRPTMDGLCLYIKGDMGIERRHCAVKRRSVLTLCDAHRDAAHEFGALGVLLKRLRDDLAFGHDGTPLTTIRMENFRDGLEDLWYVKLLEAKSGKPVEVPPEVAKSMQDYTYDPAVLAKWRDSLADELERLVNELNERN